MSLTKTKGSMFAAGAVVAHLGYTPLAPSDIGVSVQGYDADLTAIGALAGTSGLLKKTAANTWTLDTAAYLTSINSGNITTALGFTPENSANKGVANGYASLDSSGLVPASQLPSYVDDVLEYTNQAAFSGTGTTGKIYVALDTNKTYRWSGSAYVEISASPGSTDSVTEGTTNLYFTNARARGAISVSGSLSYNSTTGVISYTQPTNVSTFTNDAGYLTGSALIGYLTSATAASTYQPLDADLTSIASLAGTSGLLKKTAADTWTLDTTTYLASTAIGTTVQAYDPDLSAIAALTASSGFLKTNGAGTWTVDTATYLASTGGTLTGNLSLSSATLTVASTGANNAVNGTTGGSGNWGGYFKNIDNGGNVEFMGAGSASADRIFSARNGGTEKIYGTTNGDLYFSRAILPNGVAGTVGQVLTSNGAGVAPTWTTVSGGGGSYLPLAGGTLTGSLAFSGTGLRITGDFSNATLASRLMFQTSTANSSTSIFAIPSGTGNSAAWTAFNNSDPTNAGLIQLLAGTGEHSIRAGITGTGSYLPLAFYVNNAKAFQIGTAGQFGIGATPDYGTAGYVFKSNGAAAAPAWVAASTLAAGTLATARTFTIGSTAKSFDGSANVSWTLTEMGAAAVGQTMYIGTTALPINRTSSSLTLSGVNIDGSAGSASSANTANSLAGGAVNQIHVQNGSNSSTFITAPTTANTFLSWSGTAFTWAAAGGGGGSSSGLSLTAGSTVAINTPVAINASGQAVPIALSTAQIGASTALTGNGTFTRAFNMVGSNLTFIFTAFNNQLYGCIYNSLTGTTSSAMSLCMIYNNLVDVCFDNLTNWATNTSGFCFVSYMDSSGVVRSIPVGSNPSGTAMVTGSAVQIATNGNTYSSGMASCWNHTGNNLHVLYKDNGGYWYVGRASITGITLSAQQALQLNSTFNLSISGEVRAANCKGAPANYPTASLFAFVSSFGQPGTMTYVYYCAIYDTGAGGSTGIVQTATQSTYTRTGRLSYPATYHDGGNLHSFAFTNPGTGTINTMDLYAGYNTSVGQLVFGMNGPSPTNQPTMTGPGLTTPVAMGVSKRSNGDWAQIIVWQNQSTNFHQYAYRASMGSAFGATANWAPVAGAPDPGVANILTPVSGRPTFNGGVIVEWKVATFGLPSSNSTSFIGFASNAAASGAAVSIVTQNQKATYASGGLTAGTKYYINDDGTLGTTGTIFAGKALNTTDLIVGAAQWTTA